MALEPDRHREIIPTSSFATGNGGNGRNEGGNGRNGRNEKMEEIVAETASRILVTIEHLNWEEVHSPTLGFSGGDPTYKSNISCSNQDIFKNDAPFYSGSFFL